MSDYKNKYLKYKKKYLNSQKGGSSNSRIEERRDNNSKKLSVARIHDPTDLVLEVGQKYVFWGPKNIDGERPWPSFMPINLNYEFEELQYLGQKQVRVIGILDKTLDLDKRRDKVEKILAPEVEVKINMVTNIEFQKQHAFRRLNGTGEVLIFLDHQVLDHICF